MTERHKTYLNMIAAEDIYMDISIYSLRIAYVLEGKNLLWFNVQTMLHLTTKL